MKSKDKHEVIDAIENEGFDYCFRFYTNFDEIKDKEFHKLRKAYVDAAKELSDYIGLDE